jgi:hypothetical protein
MSDIVDHPDYAPRRHEGREVRIKIFGYSFSYLRVLPDLRGEKSSAQPKTFAEIFRVHLIAANVQRK